MTIANSLFARVLVASLTLTSFTAQADDNIRVVVQDVRPEFLGLSRNGRIVVSRGHESPHVFQVVDLQRREVVLVIDLPQQITSAVIAPTNDWCVVSGEDSIYQVDLKTGQYQTLLTETSGTVALNRSGERLAVLGSFVVDDRAERPGRMATSNLGVYDLTKKKWLAKTRTTILIDQVAFFDGDVAVGYGRGGRVFHRAASSFRCDTRLDPETGESTTTHGLELRYGARDTDDEYTPPEQLVAIAATNEKAKKQLLEINEQLNPSGAQNEPSQLFIPLPGDDPASILIDRRANNTSQAGILNIHRDGRVDLRPVEIPGHRRDYVHLVAGTLLSSYSFYRDGTITNLLDQKEAFSIVLRRDDNTTNDRSWENFLPVGCLVYRPGELSLYIPGKAQPQWRHETDKPLGSAYPIFASPDGKYVALGGNGKEVLYDILAVDDGQRVCQIKQVDETSGYSFAASFNQRCDQFGIIANKRFLIYEIPSGKLAHKEESPRDVYYWNLTYTAHRWIIGGESESEMFQLMSGKGLTIPLPVIYRTTAIRAKDRDCLLVETRYGRGAIVDLETGELLAKWYVGEYQGSGSIPAMPPRAFTAFDGKLLVRRKAHAADLELIDLKTLTSVATIQLVPTVTMLGWIISTPDGHWDASPGAEKFVAVFNGLDRSNDEQTKSRRDSKVIRSRLAEIAAR